MIVEVNLSNDIEARSCNPKTLIYNLFFKVRLGRCGVLRVLVPVNRENSYNLSYSTGEIARRFNAPDRTRPPL